MHTTPLDEFDLDVRLSRGPEILAAQTDDDSWDVNCPGSRAGTCPVTDCKCPKNYTDEYTVCNKNFCKNSDDCGGGSDDCGGGSADCGGTNRRTCDC